MKKLSSLEIRQLWLDFFKSKGHSVEPSASLIPQNDPTLLWINAGVTPLKKYFDGSVVPNNPRITNAQKCLRTNDIENVGKTARHHTFFEMLGNFSIGDYFKKDVLPWAAELLMDKKWFGFSADKLYITYYADDLETKNIWESLGISSDHLIPMKSNFWEIGEGPCGPDTEIFYDRGEVYDTRGKELIEQDLENDRYIEIWNIVFSQFNSKEGVAREDYQELPHKNIDTGCGLERIACVMQGVDTNYDTDLFIPIIKKVEEICGVKYEGQMAFKVIADHVRTVTFAVADGAALSNEGRGYVLRRILRRATKHGKKLGINQPFMAQLVDVVVDIMKGFYPYLVDKASQVKEVITREEEKFLSTISNGEKKFEAIAQNASKQISGEDAFLLYDTYGFPFELTVEYAMERNLTVNEEEFKKAMNAQKERARNARKDINSMGGQNEEYLNFREKSEFIGYELTTIKSKIIKVFAEGIVTEKTPFYAFSGGQLCDKGTIDNIEVLDVKKLPNGQHIHVLAENNFKEGQIVELVVDKKNRELTRANHSAAHLLQAALKKVLGDHVHQQGSQVCASYVRFDFNNYQSLTDEQLLQIEHIVNEYINQHHKVNTKVLPVEEAKKLDAVALFDDKYGDMVRVVDMEISKEFCAGTHVSNTGNIKHFAIVGYESIGSGIYRITGVTGDDYMALLKEGLTNLKQELQAISNKACNLVNSAKDLGISLAYKYDFSYNDIVGYAYILKLHEEIALASKTLYELEKEFKNRQSQKALQNLEQYDSLIEDNKLVIKVDSVEASLVKEMAIALQNNKRLDVCLIASVFADKVTFVCATNGIIDASGVIKEATKITGGGGGGKINLAQAGGKDVTKVDEALKAVKEKL